MDPTKIQIIRDWPSPQCFKGLCSLLGLANFYHRFVFCFSHLAWPLNQSLKGGTQEKIWWIEEKKKAFEDLKIRLSSAPILVLPYLQ